MQSLSGCACCTVLQFSLRHLIKKFEDHVISCLHTLHLLHVTRRLERLVDVLRRKISGASVDEKPASSEQSPSESLVSTVSSSSTAHSPQVTMSGPVTDL
jgi:hypothetical protein